MTSELKEKIVLMRGRSMGYTEIADELGISKDTVKSFCRRNQLGGKLAVCLPSGSKDICRECGKPIKQTEKRKPKKFCSDECRKKWWKEHPDSVQKKAVYTYVCGHCGKAFTAYGNSHRKYCCHSCYIAARFKERRRNACG